MSFVRQFFLLIIALGSNLAPAANKVCEELLGPSALIRYFRQDFDTTRTGTYFKVNGRLVFLPHDSVKKPVEQKLDKNSAAHLEILKRQVGAEAFEEIISSSSSPIEGLEQLIEQQQSELADDQTEFDVDAIFAEVSRYPSNIDLPQALEDKILAAIRHFERLAMPLTAWLRPKVIGRRLEQLPNSSFTDGITAWFSPTVRVHKANLVTLRLNGVKQFVISSGYYPSPDSYHKSSMAFLSLLVPESRLVEKERPGYLVVKAWDESLLQGQIQFVTKGSLEVLQRESYDFRTHRK